MPLTSRLCAALLLLSSAAFGEGTRRDDPRARAEWNAAFRRDARGFVDARHRLDALQHACRLPADPSMAPRRPGSATPLSFGGTVWEPIGPRPIDSGQGWGTASGRVTALAYHPTDSAILLAGSATGGIWKSTDAGATWRPVSDGAPAVAISSIAFSPSNTNVVYAATGEADSADLEFHPSRSFGTYLGAGVLRSVDQGETWTRIDTNLPPNSVVSRVLVHPRNPQLVLAGLYITGDLENDWYRLGGLWRSTDGGVTFVETFAHAVSDLAQDPNDPDVVYAAFGVTHLACRTPCPPDPSYSAPPSGVYRSADFGATLAPVLVPATPGATFQSPTGNIKLGLTRTSPVTIYASVLDTHDSHAAGGIYRSTDAGATWIARGNDPGMCRDSSADFGGQCEYDHFILPIPGDPGAVFFGGIDLFSSTDGGGSWTNLSNVYGGFSADLHPDQHAGAFPPGSPGTLTIGNDGGVCKTTDGGRSFASLNATLTLAQFNALALHPSDPNAATGGTQDNGNLRFTGTLTWSDRTGGDGGFNLIRADAPQQRLAGIYYNVLYYSADGGASYRDVTPRLGDDEIGFYPPAAAAPAAPGLVFIGSTRVWASSSFGRDGVWTARAESPIVSTSDVITALEVVGDGSGVLWAGTRLKGGGTPSYGVHLSRDGGKTFTRRSGGLPNAIVTRIRAATPDGLTAYVTFGGYSGLPSRHVFLTTDGGASFRNLSGDLPDVPVSSLAIDPADPGDLFIGTDVGVFRSRDGGASWTSFGAGLPNVTVSELVFHPKSGDLWAATYGRGVFRVPAAGGTAVVPSADFSFAPQPPAPGESVAFTDLSFGAPDAWSWQFGDGAAATERSPRHAYTQPGTYRVSLVASNAAGSSTAAKDVTVTAGSASPVQLLVPVVLDVFGVPPTHFTSDLVAVNRSGAPTRLSLDYFPAPGTPGTGGPKLGVIVGSGREWRVADVLAHLRTNGWDLPPSGTAEVGSLRLTFEDAADPSLVWAGSRTSTPNPNSALGGSFGLFAAASVTGMTPGLAANVFGLREDASFRSNLAILDVPGGLGPAALSLQVMDGDTGLPAGAPIEYQLADAEWHQFDHVLASAGVTNGWVAITKNGHTSNTFVAYGVVNEARTGDGSWIGTDGGPGLVPIILSVDASGVRFTSELVLVNPTGAAVTVSLTYTPSAALGGSGGPYAASVPLGAGRQFRVPDAIAWLRDTLHVPLPLAGTSQGGSLLVAGAAAFARTSNPNPDTATGGSFGVAYPAVPAGARAKTEAWVYGLVQDAATRSNLAIADARVGDAAIVDYVVEIYDADSGSPSPVLTFDVPLAGGQWWQRGEILSGLAHGWARVRPRSGTSDFVIYGVLNDGAHPGDPTSDGSYVPMSAVR